MKGEDGGAFQPALPRKGALVVRRRTRTPPDRVRGVAATVSNRRTPRRMGGGSDKKERNPEVKGGKRWNVR